MRFITIFRTHLALLLVVALSAAMHAQSTIDQTGQAPAAARQLSPADHETTDNPTGNLDKTALVTIPEALVTPVIDGVFDTGEWSDAMLLQPGTVVSPSYIWVKNDACYLYIAAEITGLTYFGNSNMINMWVDINRNGQWDSPVDGNLAIPAPGDKYPRYPNNVAAWGYTALGGDWYTSSSGYLRYHRPWYNVGVTIPESEILVRMVNNYVSSKAYIEARIDFVNGPVKLTGGVPFRTRMHTYAGHFTSVPYNGTCQIQGQWPSVNGSYWGSYPSSSYLTDVEITDVQPPPDNIDILDVRIGDNPVFGSKAYVTGTDMNLEIDYIANPPPQNINYRVRFYGPYPSTALLTTVSGTAVATSATGTVIEQVPLNIPIGFYSVEAEADDPWVCGIRKVKETASILVLGPGQIPCSVWPGDVNVDGIVNYGDKQSLNEYIHYANLNPNWLQGYYRMPPGYPEALAEIEYRAQAALPWNTPEGCHMDTDGNGVVNSFDYIAIKMNWFQTHGTGNPKDDLRFNTAAFDISQNYPNPFNPSTKLDYSVPERSTVSLTVTDMLGRTVATLVDGTVQPGVHTANFDAEGLASGQYLATINMVGEDSGLSFTKSVKMILNK